MVTDLPQPRKASNARSPKRQPRCRSLIKKWSREKAQNTFLELFRSTGGDIEKAAKAVGYELDSIRTWCRSSPIFAEAFEAAKRDVAAALDDRMPGLASRALDVVGNTMDTDAPALADVRLRAATTVLKSVGVFKDKQTLEHQGEVHLKVVWDGNGTSGTPKTTTSETV